MHTIPKMVIHNELMRKVQHMLTYNEFIKLKNAKWQEQKRESKLIKMKDIGRKGHHYFLREAWTFMVQHNLKEKVFVIERLKLIKTEHKITHSHIHIGHIEYRIGYYIIGKNGTKKNKWTWGQYCPLIPQQDFSKLFSKAKNEGTI